MKTLERDGWKDCRANLLAFAFVTVQEVESAEMK